MKKILHRISIILAVLFLSTAVFANTVDSIEIDVIVQQDGSLDITQIWHGEFYDGTENYIPMQNVSGISISNYRVFDDNNTLYETIDNWDVNADFYDKANRCGINYVDEGYEICFGISQYGERTYTLQYTLSNVVKGYTDQDGVNFRFVNDSMNTTPTDVDVEISLWDGTPITDDIANTWAFGFEGQVNFQDGKIIAYTEEAIDSYNHVTIMFSFDKGILLPETNVNGSFETVKEIAFEGSDYTNKQKPSFVESVFSIIFSAIFVIGLVVTPLLFIIVFVGAFIMSIKRKITISKFAKEQDYFRDIPNNKNLLITYKLGKSFQLCNESAILSVKILDFIHLGYLTAEKTTEVGFFGKEKEVVNLYLIKKSHEIENELDKMLFEILEMAAGEDRILIPEEIKKYSRNYSSFIRSYIRAVDKHTTELLLQMGYWKPKTIGSVKKLTDEGRKQLGEIFGFKKYLEDFSLIAERGVNELQIWKEILVYAMLLGIADKVSQELKNIYPELTQEVDIYYRSHIFVSSSYRNVMYNGMRSAESSSSGSGGSSSSGGGGGSSGGGSGGGSR